MYSSSVVKGRVVGRESRPWDVHSGTRRQPRPQVVATSLAIPANMLGRHQALHLSWIGTTRRCRRSPDSQVERSHPCLPRPIGPVATWNSSSLVTVARTVSDLHRLPDSASPSRV